MIYYGRKEKANNEEELRLRQELIKNLHTPFKLLLQVV